MSDSNPEDDRQQRIQRALNEAKKRELKKKYDMDFSEGKSELPPDLEGDWLNHIEEFERQYQSGKRTTVREFIGDPSVKPVAEIAPGELEAELNKLLDLLESRNIAVDFLCEVESLEAYRFIAEELMDEEMDDIHVEGMTQHFIYEEFHPNDEYDAKQSTEHFLHSLLNRNTEFLLGAFSKEELYDANGSPITLDEMKTSVDDFLATVAMINNSEINVTRCRVEGDYATVEAETSWEGLNAETMAIVSASGPSAIRLKRSPYGGWDVVQAKVAGWN
ncbi:MAG: hypothetical protein DMG06_09925 [Acidobacteria bacterium]|nr:MAG: hypothetical protein DMG06_09925 [Acidobacteriota bacterium]